MALEAQLCAGIQNENQWYERKDKEHTEGICKEQTLYFFTH